MVGGTRFVGCRASVPVAVVGPTPPPYHGVSVATSLVLEMLRGAGFTVYHVETKRRLAIGGVFNVVNLLKDILRLCHLLALRVRGPYLSYLPIAQTRLGAVRDAFCILLLRGLGVPVVVHLHGAHFRRMYEGSPGVLKGLVRSALRRVDAVIVLGDSLRQIFDGLVDQERIHVVPNGIPASWVPDEEFQALQRERAMRKGMPLRVLYLSNLVSSKGYLDLLHAIAHCRRLGVPVFATFAGAWMDSSRTLAETIVCREHIGDVVAFVGPVSGDEKRRLLGETDVFVLPAYNEGQPIAILEAMAFGLPVISTAAGCITDMVRDGYNGYIVPTQDPVAIARRLAALYYDPVGRLEMGARSRELYKENFTAEKMLGLLQAVLHKVLANR